MSFFTNGGSSGSSSSSVDTGALNEISSELDSLTSLVTVEIDNGVLQLTKDRFQKVVMEDCAEIVLPTVTDFCEIHLFFDAEEELTIVTPDGVRWQQELVVESNKSYELVFTYVTRWLGGVVIYE